MASSMHWFLLLILSTSFTKGSRKDRINASLHTKINHNTGNGSSADITSVLPFTANVELYTYSLHKFCQRFYIPVSNCSCPTTALVCEALQLVDEEQNYTSIYRRANGFTITYATIALMSSAFGVAGNAVVILMAYRCRSNLSPCKLHIAELAFVNFVFSALQVLNVVPLYWTNSWIYSDFMCKFTKGLLEMSSLLSSGFFQLIAAERYLLIIKTFNIPGFQRHLKHRTVICNLILVLITILPFFHGIQREAETRRCISFIGGKKWIALPYAWFTFILYSVLPICVSSVLAINLNRYFAKEKNSLLMINRAHLNRRILVNMLTVLSLFILCTVPSRLVTITMDTVDYQSHDAILTFQFISYILYSLQGTLNPILYSMLARQWRRNASKIVRSMFRRGKHGSLHAVVTISIDEDIAAMNS